MREAGWYRRERFEVDPTLCLGEEGRFLEWGNVIGRRIAPLGELGTYRLFLGMDEQSGVCLVITWVASYGRMPQAIENLVLGVKPTVVAEL